MKKIACRRFMELRIRKVDSTGTITTVAGYPSVLRTVHIPLITPEDCRENSFGTREIVHERTLCAGVEGKTCRPAGRCVGNVHVGGRQPEAVKQVQDEAVRAILEAFEKLRSLLRLRVPTGAGRRAATGAPDLPKRRRSRLRPTGRVEAAAHTCEGTIRRLCARCPSA